MLSFDNYIHVYCGVFVGIRSIYLFKQKKLMITLVLNTISINFTSHNTIGCVNRQPIIL